jgi:hypothetical protein
MYCYLYDDFIQENKRFEKELLRIENRLTDLGIAGKISRLALFRNAEEMIRDEIDRGTTTVVVVGNDDTVRKVLNVMSQSDVVLGIIPIGPNNELSRVMGVPEGVAACDVLSARRVSTIDVGTINGRKFVTGVSVPEFKAELMADNGRFRIVSTSKSQLEIRNLQSSSDPCDGTLDVVIDSQVKSTRPFGRKKITQSVVPFRSLAIRSDLPISLLADGQEMQATRFDISIDSRVLRVITGKDRTFSG